MPAIIETRALSKSFGDCVSNNSINLKINSGTLHAIVGENGAGKSTLMKLLFGLEKPTSGEIYLRGERIAYSSALDAIAKGVGMVQQHFALVENASAIENIILGAEPVKNGLVDTNSAIQDLEKLLPGEALRVPWKTKVENLSVGFRQRVEILKVIYRRAEVLIFDEPTAVLTPQESEELYKILVTLKNSGKTVLLITHKLEDVMRFADEYTVLRRGELVGSGKVSEVKIQDLVQLMVGRSLQLPKISKSNPGEVALEFKKVTTHAFPFIKNLSFSIRKGEILGIAGVEGAGQKPLVDAILGLEKYSGEISLNKIALDKLDTRGRRALGIANVPEDRAKEGIWANGASDLNVVPGREKEFFHKGFISLTQVREKAKKWFDQFDVRLPQIDTPAGRLSGGNQQKLILARELAERKFSLLICHQPTRGVDIGAIEKIHNLLIDLRSKGTSILLISSDLDELFALSDRILVLFDGKLQQEIQRADYESIKVGRAMTGARNES
jgi:general nucleoside transport system ATP-binding protein